MFNTSSRGYKFLQLSKEKSQFYRSKNDKEEQPRDPNSFEKLQSEHYAKRRLFAELISTEKSNLESTTEQWLKTHFVENHLNVKPLKLLQSDRVEFNEETNQSSKNLGSYDNCFHHNSSNLANHEESSSNQETNGIILLSSFF